MHEPGRLDQLVRSLVTLHRKRVHRSGGELELGCGLGGSALSPLGGFEFAAGAFGGAVAVADVLGECGAEGVPVEVVGVLADELVDGAEGALDPVEVASVGRGRYQLQVVGGRPGADLRGPVAGEAAWVHVLESRCKSPESPADRVFEPHARLALNDATASAQLAISVFV